MAWLLPFVGTHSAYLLASAAETVPTCIPYLTGCTSISATGRQPPASFAFRGLMMPAAIVMFAYWYLARRWLRLHGDNTLSARLLPWLGFLAMLFLLVYTAVLGHIGDAVATVRRMSVVSYLSVNLLGQLLFVNRIQHLSQDGRLIVPAWIPRTKVAICGAMILIGILIIPVSLFIEDSGRIDNVIEWNYSLLLVFYYLVTAFAWRADRFRLTFSVGE